MADASLAESWGLLPESVLKDMDAATKDRIVKAVIDDARQARFQAWIALLLAFLTIPSLIVLAWHLADKGAATQAAVIITSGAVGLVGLFLGARVTSNLQRDRAVFVPTGGQLAKAAGKKATKAANAAPATE